MSHQIPGFYVLESTKIPHESRHQFMDVANIMAGHFGAQIVGITATAGVIADRHGGTQITLVVPEQQNGQIKTNLTYFLPQRLRGLPANKTVQKGVHASTSYMTTVSETTFKKHVVPAMAKHYHEHGTLETRMLDEH